MDGFIGLLKVFMKEEYSRENINISPGSALSGDCGFDIQGEASFVEWLTTTMEVNSIGLERAF
jgi:hypothetical protein